MRGALVDEQEIGAASVGTELQEQGVVTLGAPIAKLGRRSIAPLLLLEFS